MLTVFRLFHVCKAHLPANLKKEGLVIIVVILLSTFIDLLGIASIFPIFSLYLSDSLINNKFFGYFYSMLNFSSKESFFYFLVSCAGSLLILKAFFITFSTRLQGRYIYSIYSFIVKRRYQSIYSSKETDFKANSDDFKGELYLLPRVFSNQLMVSLLNIIADSIILILVLTFLFIYDWQTVLLLMTSVLPVFYLFFKLAKDKINTVDKALNEFLSKISRAVSIAFFGRLEILLTNKRDYFSTSFESTIDEERKLLTEKLVLTKLPIIIVELGIFIAVLILFIYNLRAGKNAQELLIQISIFGIAAFKLMPSINRIVLATVNIKANFYSTPILTQSYPESAPTKSSSLSFSRNIQLKDVSFRYEGGSEILSKLNLDITKGDRIGIVGQSGSGKTTLLSILIGELDPLRGEVLIDKVKLSKENLISWHRLIAMVHQNVFLLDDTIEANIAFGETSIDKVQLEYAIKFAALSDFIGSLEHGVKTNIGEMGTAISGGQRQRIAIARALYHGAEVIFLDEATSSLDTDTEKIIIKAVENLPEEITIVTISHKASFLEFCNKIYELKAGKLNEVSARNY